MPTDEMRPAWPPWYGVAALAMAFVGTVFFGGITLAVIAQAADLDTDAKGFNLALTLIQDVALVVCALYLAAQVRKPTLAQFGIRPVRFLTGLKWAAIAFAIYFVVARIYIVFVDTDQTTLEDLGSGKSWAVTALIGVMVVAIAPVIEEFFFRGFMFGAFRTRMPFIGAALLDGVVFGVVHAGTGPSAIPPLIALGFAFCLVYEKTGSILPCICLHAFNNMLAFAADKSGDAAVAVTAFTLVVLACVTLPGRRGTLS